jgi:ribulose-5-phosphate 4-epimerase/fuculose-1-phosphate aldolase
MLKVVTTSTIRVLKLCSIMGVAHKRLFSDKTDAVLAAVKNLPTLPSFDTPEEERLHRKQRLAAAFRIFSQYGFDEGVAGHITARDPVEPDTFWVNAFGIHFSQITVSNLIRVNHEGKIVEGKGMLNAAAFAIHSKIHAARPEAVAAAHTHAPYGRAWSTLGRPLDPITQDSCAFYNDHAVYNEYGGVAVDLDEGERIAAALGQKKAVILQSHGLLTVGESVDAAAWWYIALERCCQVQLLAESAAQGKPLIQISSKSAAQAAILTGTPAKGWFQFQSLYAKVLKEQPDFLN